MLPKKNPRKDIAICKLVVERSLNLNVSTNEEQLAKAIAVIATGDRFPYVRSVSGPRMHVPSSVAIS